MSEVISNLKNENKILGYDEAGVALTMKKRHFFGDGVAQFALNSFTGLAAQLTYFYTNQIGMAAGVIGFMLLIAGIVDITTDLFAGRLIDRTKSKYGKARPWFLWLAIPAAVIMVGMFLIPANASQTFQQSYIFITHVLAIGVIYTILNIAYQSLMVTRTKSSKERESMGIYRTISGYASGMIIAIFLIPLTNMLGGDQRAWIVVTGTFAIFSAVALIITFLSSNEKNSEIAIHKNRDEDVAVLDSLRMLIKNKNWVVVSLGILLMQIQWNLGTGVGVFYAEYVLGDPNLVGVMGAVGFLPTLLGFFVAPVMIKKWGAIPTVKVSLMIAIISISIRVIFPASFMVAIVFGSIAGFTQIPYMMATPVLTSNTYEWNEWKYGYRLLGIGQGVGNFCGKVGVTLGTVLIGWILALGGFESTFGNSQPQTAIYSIYALSIWIPLVINIFCYILFTRYDLHEYYGDIVQELEDR